VNLHVHTGGNRLVSQTVTKVAKFLVNQGNNSIGKVALRLNDLTKLLGAN
jgi:hypothetical protein